MRRRPSFILPAAAALTLALAPLAHAAKSKRKKAGHALTVSIEVTKAEAPKTVAATNIRLALPQHLHDHKWTRSLRVDADVGDERRKSCALTVNNRGPDGLEALGLSLECGPNARDLRVETQWGYAPFGRATELLSIARPDGSGIRVLATVD